MLYRKNIIIAIAALLVVGGVWFASRVPAPTADNGVMPFTEPRAQEAVAVPAQTATNTPEKVPLPVVDAKSAAIPPRVILAGNTDFLYDIVIGKTPCGDKIGTLEVQSSDPSRELYWGMTGTMPIWLTFSQTQGKTPAKVDMIFNCILSGAEEKIDWKFTIVEMTKEGKYVDGYARIFSLKGDMKK